MNASAREMSAIRPESLLRELNAEETKAFRALQIPAIYRARQMVFLEGAPAEGLYIVCRGAVKICQTDPLGQTRTLCVAGPGDILGEVRPEPVGRYTASAEAMAESQLSFLPRTRLENFVVQHPMAAVRLIEAMSRAVGMAHRKARLCSVEGAQSRVAALLLQLARTQGGVEAGVPARIRLDYSRRELAETIGITAETTSRVLSRLRREMTIALERHYVIIHDAGRLELLAQAGRARGE